MKTSVKLISLFSCFLLISSVAYSNALKEEQFNLLSHYNNSGLVEDSLKLATSSSGLAASTVINYGFWYGICKSLEVLPALADHFDLSGTEQIELRGLRLSFCNQLAAIITSTEVALAGQVTLWPYERPWWQPLRFVGTAYTGYKAYTSQEPHLVPTITAAYFTHEVIARTVAGASAIQAFRHRDKDSIRSLNYAGTEYTLLSSVAGMMAGAIIYDQMRLKGATHAKAAFAYLVAATLTKRISAISSFSAYNPNRNDRIDIGSAALTGTGAIAESMATAMAGYIAVSAGDTSDIFLSTAALGTAAVATPRVSYKVGFKSIAGMAVGAVVMRLLLQQGRTLDSDHLLRNIALTLAPALALALINGVSNNVVYGYSLEESFTDTTYNQWKKFRDPLDYLYTLFN
ncbi:hypothetical protein [Endozoicomonas sp. 4G]|uniref:hypothetical protein n=1 Tax=Endozoicomonas sp. 4G TaxID=2872754 RepID=UPI00207889F0|nr:hypothetical protein [Endozoicomonas sp. 4G]